MADARIIDCTDEEYFADPCATPSLSQSIAHTLVTKSPYHAWIEHPKLGGVGRPSTRSKDHGSLVHSLLLGAGKELRVIDAENYRTKAAQAARDEAREAGLLPVLRHEADAALPMVRDIRRGLAELGIDFTGASEVKVEWTEHSAHGPVLCRGMMDHLIRADGVIYDVKTCRTAHPRSCARHVVEYGYDIQHAAYTSALRKLEPDVAGRERFVFLFIEELPDGAPRRVVITPAELDGQLRELGHRRWDDALNQWAWCLSRDSWTGYADRVIQLEAPPWALTQHMDEAS